MRVLHCIYDDPANPWVGGGGARRVFDLYRHLGDRVQATIATGAYPGAHSHRVDDIDVRRLGVSTTYVASRLAYAASASRLLQGGDFDVAVVDHSAYAPVVIPRGRPVGLTVHHITGLVARERWGAVAGGALALVERSLIRRARVFSATSAATEHALAEIVSEDVRVVPVASGVSNHLFTLPHDEAGYALYIGRLDETQKGLDVLLEAWALVAREHPKAELRIAGRGPHREALRAHAAALGIAEQVMFLGAVSDEVRDMLLTGATCQVMPSRFEGFGIAAAEALAAGVPLIVSDDPSLAEIVGGGSAGVIVPRGDATALASAMLSLLRDRNARTHLSAAGRERAQRYRWDVVADAHLAYLRLIMDECRSSSTRRDANE